MEIILSIAALGYCVYLKYQLTDLENTVRLFDRLHDNRNIDNAARLQKLESDVCDLKWTKLEGENPDPTNNIINFRR